MVVAASVHFVALLLWWVVNVSILLSKFPALVTSSLCSLPKSSVD